MMFAPLFNVSASFLDKLAELSCTLLMGVGHGEDSSLKRFSCSIFLLYSKVTQTQNAPPKGGNRVMAKFNLF